MNWKTAGIQESVGDVDWFNNDFTIRGIGNPATNLMLVCSIAKQVVLSFLRRITQPVSRGTILLFAASRDDAKSSSHHAPHQKWQCPCFRNHGRYDG